MVLVPVIIRDLIRAARDHQQARETLIEADFVLRQQNQTILAMARNYADLAISWRISMEKPEIDLRDEVDRVIRLSLDEVAKLEEHMA